MRKSVIVGTLTALVLLTATGFAATSVTKTRHPIPVTRDYFNSLNAMPRHQAVNKLSAATSAATQAQSASVVTIPSFNGSFTYAGTTYPFTMVGQLPTKGKSTTVPTSYVPMSFFFDEFVDQNGNNIVIDTTTITNEIKTSPIFEPSSYATGFTQFEDADMRAEFYPAVKSHNDFHVLLGKPQTLIPVTVEVPVGSSQVFVDPDGTYLALIDINFINSQLNTLLQTEPINTTSIPIFVSRNAVYGDFSDGQPLDCCIGGFHTAFESKQVGNKVFVQVFGFATSLDSDVADFVFGDPGVFADVNALSHELGEIFNDPFINNVTPSYQLPGFPTGTCQNLLEVGDVVEGLSPDYTDVTLHGFTYHPQTLGLLQYFAAISPSNAIDGDYSFPDPTRLTAPFTPCPAP